MFKIMLDNCENFWLKMCNGMCSVVALLVAAITELLAFGLLRSD